MGKTFNLEDIINMTEEEREIEIVTIGPKDGIGFDKTLDYTEKELDELYNTISKWLSG